MTVVEEDSVEMGSARNYATDRAIDSSHIPGMTFPGGGLGDQLGNGVNLPRMPMTVNIPELPMRIRPIGAPVDPMEQLRMLGIGQKDSLPPAKILELAKRLEVHVATYGSYILHLRPNTVEDIASAHRSAGADKSLVDDWVDIATLLRRLHN